MNKAWTTAALALSVAAIAPAQAQLSEEGGPIAYSADNLEYRDNDRQLFLTGNVDVQQDQSRLQADRLTLYFKPSAGGRTLGSGEIDRIVAEGRVVYVTPTQKAKGERAVYDTDADTVTFSGDVVVATAENVIRGETLVLRISSGDTTILPGAGGRVQGVLQNAPRPKNGAPAAAPSGQQQNP